MHARKKMHTCSGDDEPINNPIGQTGGQTVTPPGKNPEEMSYEEYRAWREGK